jgi:PKHD-type hydroxylase
MLLQIPNVLSPEQVAFFKENLHHAPWTDGRITAGHQGAKVKHNQQLPQNDPLSHALGEIILSELETNPLFMMAALPLKVMPPFFNRYGEGATFGTHIDGAIRQISGTPHRIRTDLSATLFLSDSRDYDGGELVIEDTLGTHSVKLDAGSMILYPASSLHHVTPITRGVRLASFFWIQSMIRDDGQRNLLYDLDSALQDISLSQPDHPTTVSLAGVYNNLLRRWADV